MNTPLVSVIIPCYNQAEFLPDAINSLVLQTNPNWEAIIVDDGSPDNIEEVAKQLISNDSRVRFIHQENLGVSAARNHGVRDARGEYICFLDADDWYSPHCIESIVQNFTLHPNCSLYYLKNERVEEGKKEKVIWGFSGSYNTVLLYGMNITYAIRRHYFLDIGGFDENMKEGCEDWEFGIRFLHKYPQVYNSAIVLYYYRQHNNENRLTKTASKNLNDIYLYIFKKNMDIFIENLGSPIVTYRWNFSHQWSDRRLPQYIKKILDIKGYLFHLLRNK